MISLAPLCCDLDAAELSCQHTRRDSDANRYYLLLFETQKGGAGMASKLFEQWEQLLHRAVELIEGCDCEDGCPKCIVAPYCGEHNHGLDKQAALMIGKGLALCSSCASPPSGCGRRGGSDSRQRREEVVVFVVTRDVRPELANLGLGLGGGKGRDLRRGVSSGRRRRDGRRRKLRHLGPRGDLRLQRRALGVLHGARRLVALGDALQITLSFLPVEGNVANHDGRIRVRQHDDQKFKLRIYWTD